MNRIFQPFLVSFVETHIPNSWVGTKGSDLIRFRDSNGNKFHIKEVTTVENAGYLECIRMSDGEKMSPEPARIMSGDDSGLEQYVQEVARFVAANNQS